MHLRPRSATVTLLIITGALVLPTGQAEGAPPLTEAQAVKAYAPLVKLHPGEKHLPMNPGDFIAGSRLRYDQPFADHQETDQVDPAKLGSGGYVYKGHTTNEPRDKNTDGWFLELTNETLRNGTGTGANALYRFVPGESLTWWFFYGYSNSEGPINHEGDWERISVQLGPDNRARTVAYWRHNGHCAIPWKDVPRVNGTHPVVYSALGDHASYPNAGVTTVDFFGTDRRADGGRQWNLAALPKVNLPGQSWFGYTGAWGEIGNSEHTTGPQGPAAKPVTPADFADPC
jgi:hypothetical protein